MEQLPATARMQEVEQCMEQLPATARMQEVEQCMEQLPATARMQEVEQCMEQLPATARGHSRFSKEEGQSEGACIKKFSRPRSYLG